jgi:hypothetical protein
VKGDASEEEGEEGCEEDSEEEGEVLLRLRRPSAKRTREAGAARDLRRL